MEAYSSVPSKTLCVLALLLPVRIKLIKAITKLKKIGRTTLFVEEISVENFNCWTNALSEILNRALNALHEWDSTIEGRHTYELIPGVKAWHGC